MQIYTVKDKDDVHGRTSVASAEASDSINQLVNDKFAGQQIWNAGGSPKGQVAGMQPEQFFDEGNAFCKKITYKIGKKTAEESIKAFRTDPQYRIADMIASPMNRRYCA